MRSLLSTKLLPGEEVVKLESEGWKVEQYDAISIKFIKTSLTPGENLSIFTSKNAVKALRSSIPDLDPSGLRCICVGSGTGKMLRKWGFSVLEEAPTAEHLCLRIQKQYARDSFVYYCGNKRLNLIPNTLTALGVKWKEVIAYRTTLNRQYFKDPFEAVLFFSPSGVESFMSVNKIAGATGYCIGKTTAKALEKYTQKIIQANNPTMQGLIERVIATNQIKP